MTSLWPRIEPLLAQVTKPARYIGGELGARSPSRARTGGVAAAVPRHVRDRAAQPGPPDPLRDPERARRRRGRAGLRPLDRHGGGHAGGGGAPVLAGERAGRRPTSTSWPSTCRPSSPTPTSSTWSTWPGCRCGRPTGPADDPLVVAGGHCAFNPEPMADFVDAFVLGDGEEAVGDITDVVGRWQARGVDRPGRAPAGPGRRSPGSTCRRATGPPTRTAG